MQVLVHTLLSAPDQLLNVSQLSPLLLDLAAQPLRPDVISLRSVEGVTGTRQLVLKVVPTREHNEVDRPVLMPVSPADVFVLQQGVALAHSEDEPPQVALVLAPDRPYDVRYPQAGEVLFPLVLGVN